MKRRGVPPRSASYNCPGQLAELETKACCYCKMADISAFRCREQLSHVSPNWDADEAARCPDVAEAFRDAAPQVGPPPDRGTSAPPAPRARWPRPQRRRARRQAARPPAEGRHGATELQQWVRPESGRGRTAAAAAITASAGRLEATEDDGSRRRRARADDERGARRGARVVGRGNAEASAVARRPAHRARRRRDQIGQRLHHRAPRPAARRAVQRAALRARALPATAAAGRRRRPRLSRRARRLCAQELAGKKQAAAGKLAVPCGSQSSALPSRDARAREGTASQPAPSPSSRAAGSAQLRTRAGTRFMRGPTTRSSGSVRARAAAPAAAPPPTSLAWTSPRSARRRRRARHRS